MTYLLLSLAIIFLALLFIYCAYRLLCRSSWFLGWLRGMSGLCILALVMLLTFIAFDIYSYRQLIAEQAVAQIQFKKIKSQHYLATFIVAGSTPTSYELFGDQWHLDSRIIKWAPFVARLGLGTGYRLDRLSGRYLSLEDERSKPRSIFTINESPAGVDTWQWLTQIEALSAVVDARYGSAVFLPMIESGHYQILLTNSGLIARPLNDVSKTAVEQWQ